MSYELHIESEGKLLTATLRGRRETKKTVADYEVLLETCATNGIRKILIDYR
jgi:hypothetical protein